MNILFLTQVSGILKPFAWIMGVILNAIYEFVQLFGIHNIALCIFIFTFVIKMLMLPLTIKQQKYTKLSSKMSPELTKIQEKYKGKKDEESLRRQQAETQEVYSKYGTSPMGGCLPLLISLPIMFALYRVIYAIPAYVNDIRSLYETAAQSIINLPGHADAMVNFIGDNAIKITADLTKFRIETEEYTNSIIDILAKFSTANWDALLSSEFFGEIAGSISGVVEDIKTANNMFGLNILDAPSFRNLPSLIIPVLAVITQVLQNKFQTVDNPQNNKANDDNPLASSTKSMTTIMPIISGVFCLMLPIGVGVYWIASAVFTILQSIFINKYLDKTDIDEMIEKNVEKENKKKEKLGVVYDNKMAEVAKTSTKNYDTEYDSTSYKKNSKRKSVGGSDYKRSTVSYSASSIAANAHLLSKNYEEDNEPEGSDKNTSESKTEEGSEE